MKLKVLAGAKEGTEIPLKRDSFLIGRSSECTLRAGSDAISRRHCELVTTDEGVTVRDLGSRNGTLVNGDKIEKETALREGDLLKVGPLLFQVVGETTRPTPVKKPKVKSVAEAVDRAASQSAGEVGEEDISNWLLGADPTATASTRETMSFRVDETRSSKLPLATPEPESVLDDEEDAEPDAGASDAGKSGKEKKQRFGKLPSIPKKPQTKDSREAAADILREMSRRR